MSLNYGIHNIKKIELTITRVFKDFVARELRIIHTGSNGKEEVLEIPLYADEIEQLEPMGTEEIEV